MPNAWVSEFADACEEAANLWERQIVFVVGAAKSGTTWVQNLLGGHPDIVSDGESMAGMALLPTLRDALNFHNDSHTMGRDGRLDDDDLMQAWRLLVGRLFHRWCERIGELDPAVVAEKTPSHAECLENLEKLVPHMKVIHVIRDGRDVVTSGWFHNVRRKAHIFTRDYTTQKDFVVRGQGAAQWITRITRAQEWGKHHISRYWEVHYEDLVKRTVKEISGLLNFLNVAHDSTSIKMCTDAGSFENVTGGRARGVEDRDSFYRKGIVGDWRNSLDPEAYTAFMKLAGPLMRKLGYT